MTTEVRDILNDLERVRENMLALSDDIWLSIDHNDQEALEEGVAFKRSYNEKMAAFDRLSTEISVMVQQFTQVDMDEPEEIAEPSDSGRNERIVRDLNREEPHSLDEDFTFKRPYGFVLCGAGFKDVATWRRLFELVCHNLRRRDEDLFEELPDNRVFVTKRDNTFFSRDPQHLRSASKLTDTVYAEVNLSANSLRNVMRDLLKTFGISTTDMMIYLRQDRDSDE